MSAITFVGRLEASANEESALDYLGRILAHQENELIITPKGKSNLAVLQGYEDKGKIATRHEAKVLDQPTDQIIVFADKGLKDTLDRYYPRWDDNPHVLLETDRELFSFLDVLLAAIFEATGETVEPF